MSLLQLIGSLAYLLIPGAVLAILTSQAVDIRALATLCLPLSIGVHFLWSQLCLTFDINAYSSASTIFMWVSLGALLGIALFRRKRSSEALTIRVASVLLIPATCCFAGFAVAYQHLRLSGGWGSLTPNNDGQNHAFLIKNLLETGELTAASAQRYFPNVADHAGDFYPLGIHNLIARTVASTGINIPEATNVLLLLAVVLYFVNMGFLLDELESKKLLTAIFLPIGLVLVSPGFPWRPIAWGGIALIVGLSMVPGLVSAALQVSRCLASKLQLFALGFALYGIFVCHVAEVAVISLLAPLFALGLPTGHMKRVSRNLLGSLAVLTILAIPLLPSLLRGARERAYFTPGSVDAVQNVAAMLFNIGGYHSGVIIALSLAGFVVASRRDSPYRGIAVAVVLIAVVTFNLAMDPNGPIGNLTFPWYRQVERVNYNYYVILPALVVSGVSGIFSLAKTKFIRIVTNAFIVGVMLMSISPAMRQLAAQYKLQVDVTPAGSDMRAAFRFLGEHAGSSLVLADVSRSSGAMWMYPLEDVRPLIVDYGGDEGRDLMWRDKLYLLDTIGNWATDAKSKRLLTKFGVRYVLFNHRSNAVGDPRRLSLEALKQETTLAVTWKSRTATVYKYQEP